MTTTMIMTAMATAGSAAAVNAVGGAAGGIIILPRPKPPPTWSLFQLHDGDDDQPHDDDSQSVDLDAATLATASTLKMEEPHDHHRRHKKRRRRTTQLLQSSSTATTTTATSSATATPDEEEEGEEDVEDVDDDDDDLFFFDLYQSPCLVRASNDEFTDAQYHAMDMEFRCNETFYGGCRFEDTSSFEMIMMSSSSSSSLATMDTEQETESKSSAPSWNIVEWTLRYDYEVYFAKPTTTTTTSNNNGGWGGDPIPALQHLEAVVLEHLAEISGLMCPDDTTTTADAGVDGRRRRLDDNTTTTNTNNNNNSYLHDFTKDDLTRLLAISSETRHELDPDYYDCMVPVPSYMLETSLCTPVTGALVLYLNDSAIDPITPEQRISLEAGFQRLIRFGMREGLYVSGDVQHVSFIGTRIDDTTVYSSNNNGGGGDGDIGTDESESGSTASGLEEDTGMTPSASNKSTSTAPNDGNSNKKAGIIIASVGIAVLAVLVWTLIGIRKRRKQIAASLDERNGANVEDGGGGAAMTDDSNRAVDEELGGFPTTASTVVASGGEQQQSNKLPRVFTLGTTAMEEDDDNDDVDGNVGKEEELVVFVDTNQEDGDESSVGDEATSTTMTPTVHPSPWLKMIPK